MDLQELMERINAIRRHRSHLTNAFFVKPQLEKLLAKKGTRVLSTDELLLILEEESGLTRLHFYSSNSGGLARIRDVIYVEEKPVIADIVGKNPQANALAQLLLDNGFKLHSTFVRLVSGAPAVPSLTGSWIVECAEEADVGDIVGLLLLEFDELIAHIPPADDILLAVRNGEITLVRAQGQLAGFAFFERKAPKNVCLRYFIVDPRFRHQGVGSALLAHSFAQYGEGTSYTLWVGTYNSALGMYEKLNFKCDGMIDYILRLEAV